jgi:hypothetical protein
MGTYGVENRHMIDAVIGSTSVKQNIEEQAWNDALTAAIEAILDIRGTFDGDTILRAREIIKDLKR